jgi:hypothetical protein
MVCIQASLRGSYLSECQSVNSDPTRIPQIQQSSIEESKNPNLDILGSSPEKGGLVPRIPPFFKEKIDNLFFHRLANP